MKYYRGALNKETSDVQIDTTMMSSVKKLFKVGENIKWKKRKLQRVYCIRKFISNYCYVIYHCL